MFTYGIILAISTHDTLRPLGICTKHDIYCHVTSDVIAVTFLVTLSMNKFTKYRHLNLLSVHPYANYCNKVWYNLHPNKHVMKKCHG
jgi:hypothetical protein